jgi:hypothetical protein
MPLFSSLDPLAWSNDDYGIAIYFRKKRDFEKASQGTASGNIAEAFELFERLLESGEASAQKTRGGIYLPAEDVVRLDAHAREFFGLPPVWPGSVRLETTSVPNLSDFGAKLNLVDSFGHSSSKWSLIGGILSVDKEQFLPDAETYACLTAYARWREQDERKESDHLRLIHVLAEAARRGARVDILSVGRVKIRPATEIGVDAQDQSDGSIVLTPVPLVDGLIELLGETGLAADEPESKLRDYILKVEQRLGQLGSESSESILRIGSTIILLDPTQTAQARLLVSQRKVPASEATNFRRDPARWLADHPFVHGDVEFLPRVIGIGEWVGGYLGAAGELGDKIDWFDKKPEPEKQPKPPKEEDGDEDAGRREPSQEEAHAENLVTIIEQNDEHLRWGIRKEGEPDPDAVCICPDFSVYPRKPYRHQEEAVMWLGRHAERCGKPQKWSEGQAAWGAGVLLADDMGLGKTLSTLIFLREWSLAWRGKTGELPPACLIVSPLSLVDNWKREIEKAFGDALSPFHRVVQAIPAAELRSFHATPTGKDIVRAGIAGYDGTVERYGLTFGNANEQSLDQPGTIVLTTYTTLRDHRFSFAGCDWSAVVLDEAHNVKNPNALQTIAAKALKGFFRIALSGTPVENHLGDLWSLMDTVEPGALGSFADFRRRWIQRIRQDPSKTQEIGAELRDHLGSLILRRTKEESLDGLPKKNIHPVKVRMTSRQAALYDEVLDCANTPDDSDDPTRRSNRWLAAMWELRRVSLHPDLLGDAGGVPASSPSESRAYLSRSGKLEWLLARLDAIRTNKEKVLIFAIQKKFQDLLRQHLSKVYGLKIPVINGDTKAVSSRNSNETRLALIEQFSEAEGFGICILSPIAAGAGLNITAANHVIHLERHWNPAKEDQATDRAYRIGQEREVHVYFPLLEHASRPITTFDTGLNRLIEQKKGLAGSLGLIPAQAVTFEDLIPEVIKGTEHAGRSPSSPLTAKEASKLSWDLFEALIACLYERNAERVILTPKGRDHGADVLVVGHRDFGNILVQVKTTQQSRLDSEEAIRELEGAGPFYENAMGLKFPTRHLHTNVGDFSKRTRKAAKLHRAVLQGLAWVDAELAIQKITIGAVIARNAHRQAAIS